MRFYISNYPVKRIPNAEFPCIIVVSDGWNDFSIMTLFHLRYYTSSEEFDEIGQVKIMQRGSKNTALPKSFEELDDSYCSLGQNLEYYRNCKKIFGNKYKKILEALNDCATNISIREDFYEEPQFKKSLLRFSEAEKALTQAKKNVKW